MLSCCHHAAGKLGGYSRWAWGKGSFVSWLSVPSFGIYILYSIYIVFVNFVSWLLISIHSWGLKRGGLSIHRRISLGVSPRALAVHGMNHGEIPRPDWRVEWWKKSWATVSIFSTSLHYYRLSAQTQVMMISQLHPMWIASIHCVLVALSNLEANLKTVTTI